MKTHRIPMTEMSAEDKQFLTKDVNNINVITSCYYRSMIQMFPCGRKSQWLNENQIVSMEIGKVYQH